MPNETEPKVLLIGEKTSQPSRWLRFLGTTLNDQGLGTEFAGSRGLVGRLRRRSFRMAIVDWDIAQAPSIADLIKQQNLFLPIIATVVVEDSDTVRNVFRAGYHDLFSQNYDRDTLLTTLRKRLIIP